MITYERSQRHRVRLHHLEAGQKYEYRIQSDVGEVAGPYEFWTWPEMANDYSTPADNDSLRLWILGDPGVNSQLSSAVRRSAENWLQKHRRPAKPLLDLWLTTGDNAYTSGRNREYQDAIFQVLNLLVEQMTNHPSRHEEI